MDTSPTGPDFYSSPSSPASSRANWHERDGGESPAANGDSFGPQAARLTASEYSHHALLLLGAANTLAIFVSAA